MVKIEQMTIGEIPDDVTKEVVIMLVKRMFEGNKRFNDWMHETDKDPRQMYSELQEELCDALCYAELGKRAMGYMGVKEDNGN